MTIAQDCMIRDEYRCFRCGRYLIRYSWVNCHHRLYDGDGGPDTPENRITLCGFGNNLRGPDGEEWCHGFVHHNKKAAMAEGWAISKHATMPPEEIPVRHWRDGMVLLTRDYQIVREEKAGGRDSQAGDQ